MLIGAWRTDQSALARNCAELGIAHAFTSREDLCASQEVDAIFITSPDAMHRDDALLAFAHGKAVLCEKPVAMNAQEAGQMVEAAERGARSLWRRAELSLESHAGVDTGTDCAGRIGEPQLAHAQYAYPAQNAPRLWIADPTLACGGPIGDVGVHCIDALRFILEREVETVSTLARSDDLSGDVEAVASLQMQMTGDVYATVTANARSPYRTLIEMTGSEGVLVAENGLTVDRPVEVVLRCAGEVVERVTLENGDGYTRMLDDFALAFRGKRDFAATGADAVTNMKVLDAAYASWRSGRRERVG